MTSIDECVRDALSRLSPQQFFDDQNNTCLDEIECEIHVWPQTWSDASCGHDCEVSLQVITSAPTVVILGPMQDACVYHGGTFAYKIDQTDKNFWAAIDQRHMPSKQEHERQKENARV
ncbi:MAG: hypothetical protein ACXAC5_03605 [Promethearchaeota archaeon]|jgi:hypothetical protein